MKKIININFHSRVIPIEESAYEILQQYIESLRRYFANEEGREEIISDIENRFAELFSETLKKGAACVTDADVNTIIASMGRPEEFEGEDATEATPSGSSAYQQQQPGSSASQPNWQFGGNANSAEPKRLYRAENDKILGGVCAGLASYLNLDPAIMRIIFVLLTLGWGSGVLLYIVLWVVLPTRSVPVTARKRLYRNSDNRVIAGVASGLAAYFHIDVWIPRLVFALPLILSILSSILRHAFWMHWDDTDFFTGGFGGTLFITYIVLWIVLPEAVTASEKLEMRGEKVDLESIKNTIKSDLESFKGRAKEMGSEMQERFQQVGSQVRQNTQNWAAETGPVIRRGSNGFGHAIGVLFKAFFLFIAGIIAFALITALIGMAFKGNGLLHIKGFVLEGFWQNFLAWSGFFLFLVIPVVALLTWLIRRISGTRSRSHYLGYTFATLWVLGLISTIVLAGMIMNNFRSQQHVEESVSIAQPQHGKLIVRPVERYNRYEDTDWWFDIDLGRNKGFYNLSDDSLLLTTAKVLVRKSEDSAYHVRLVKISRGSSGARARELAGKIEFPVGQMDSVISLPEGFAITPREKWRNQQVLIEVSVPVGKKIMVSPSVDEYQWWAMHLHRSHIRWDDGDNWDFDFDDNFDNRDTYSYSTGVEYIMTPTGLSSTDNKYYYKDNDRRNRHNEDKDDKGDDDQPEYKDKKKDKSEPKTDDGKDDGGGYRYKGPETPPAKKVDSTSNKRTAMRVKPEDCSTCLLNALNNV